MQTSKLQLSYIESYILRQLPRAAILFFFVACLRTPVTRRVCCDAADWFAGSGSRNLSAQSCAGLTPLC